ncbi:MgtC/SapB family protein [Luteolibacter marinus]|uniref:MgtC/SapB family protein n=1 Tax=Luteolibacter marinus TaxID=2776705 RepID=UPI001868829A|nr:MgtC/SapB family protein [Luteolibacter marinus]
MIADVNLPESLELLKSFGTALGLGLLVGLQREWRRDKVAGIRTFPLITLFGALSGFLSTTFGPWVIAAALIACTSLVILGNLAALRKPDPDTGLTTEIAAVVMFLIGVMVILGHRLEAVVCSGTVMVLLQIKKPLHGMVRRIGENDLKEIARLVLAGLVILPLLPNRDMGYLDVFNPFKVWLLVVLIVGISLAAYLAGKILGGKKGTLLAGILGGLISSTATTASVARRSKSNPQGAASFAVIALIASAVVFARVLVEVWVAAPGEGRAMIRPLAVMMAWTALVAAVAYRVSLRRQQDVTEDEAPSELKGAVLFALLYIAVLYGVAFAKEELGDTGLFAVAAVSGLTDMDAITLSTSRLVSGGHVETTTGWRLILVGGMANLVFKGGMVAVLGTRAMIKATLLGFAAALAGGAALLALWPG